MLSDFIKLFQFQTHDSDVFTLGLLFFFMLTNGGNPMAITLTFFKNEICHDSKINLKPLDLLRKDTDTILFIDLIKKMIRKTPDQRETCDNLIKHAALKSNEERLEIVQLLSNKCFFQDKCINEYLVKMMDKNGVHMKESLREESDAWQEFLVGGLMLPEDLDIKICSSLLKILSKQVTIYFWMLSLLHFIIVFIESPRFTPANHGSDAKLLSSPVQYLPRRVA